MNSGNKINRKEGVVPPGVREEETTIGEEEITCETEAQIVVVEAGPETFEGETVWV